MYSPRIHLVSHTMNKNANANRATARTNQSRSQRGGKNARQGRPSGLSRNPVDRSRSDTALSLTRAQFTATSPLGLWELSKGSTPGGCRIRGRELLGALVTSQASSGAYQNAQLVTLGGGGYTIIPINPYTFPRLRAISSAYEFFIFHKCDVLFQANQPTTATGEILASVDYDATDAAPTSTIQQMSNITSTMSNIYSDCSMQLLKDLSRFPRYTVSAADESAPVTDRTNQASMVFSVEGVTTTAGQTIGYAVAEYDVEFFSPCPAH
jgi:hypothetical protein